MSNSLISLLKLQDRDLRILALQKELKQLPLRESAAKSRLDDDTLALQKAHEGVLNVELKIKQLELDINTRKDSLTKLKNRQFEVRNNDEFRAIGQDIERVTAEISKIEDVQLEWMEKLETFQKTELLAKQAYDTTKSFVDEEIRVLHQRNEANLKRIQELHDGREEDLKDLPAEDLLLYERLLKSKSSAVVVPVESDKCGGCHLKLTPSTQVALKQRNRLVQCENCARILYLA